MVLILQPTKAVADEGPCDIPWRAAYYQEGKKAPLRAIVRCAVLRWPVAGGLAKARAVIRCESGFRPDAYNPGGYGGLMQHSLRYWPARVENLLPERWGISPGWRSARANIIVGIRMAHAGGW